MARGFFKNVGADVRQLVEESFLELEEAFRYAYTRSNGSGNSVVESQIYTYKSLLRELQKNNIDIADINIIPADIVPMFGMLRLTCLFKNREKDPIVIGVVSQNLEYIMDDYYSDEA